PQAYEPFDDDMLAAIDAIDADEIEAGMQARLDAIDREHPELQVKTKVTDESFDMVRNSIEFMKAAAKDLSPVFLLDTLMLHGEELLFGTPQERAEKTKEVIAAAKRNQEAYAPLAPLDLDQKSAYYNVHYKAGWRLDAGMDPFHSFADLTDWDAWGRRNAEKAVAIHDRKLACTATVRENATLLAEIKRLAPNSTIDADIHGMDVRDAYQKLVDVANQLRRKERHKELVAQINARFSDQLNMDDLSTRTLNDYEKKYREFVRWGG